MTLRTKKKLLVQTAKMSREASKSAIHKSSKYLQRVCKHCEQIYLKIMSLLKLKFLSSLSGRLFTSVTAAAIP